MAARDAIVQITCRTQSLTNGKVRRTTRYTSAHIEWLAAYEPGGGRCFYIPAAELGAGRDMLSLRLVPARNNQRAGIRMAEDYALLRPPEMEPAGIEPATS